MPPSHRGVCVQHHCCYELPLKSTHPHSGGYTGSGLPPSQGIRKLSTLVTSATSESLEHAETLPQPFLPSRIRATVPPADTSHHVTDLSQRVAPSRINASYQLHSKAQSRGLIIRIDTMHRSKIAALTRCIEAHDPAGPTTKTSSLRGQHITPWNVHTTKCQIQSQFKSGVHQEKKNHKHMHATASTGRQHRPPSNGRLRHRAARSCLRSLL